MKGMRASWAAPSYFVSPITQLSEAVIGTNRANASRKMSGEGFDEPASSAVTSKSVIPVTPAIALYWSIVAGTGRGEDELHTILANALKQLGDLRERLYLSKVFSFEQVRSEVLKFSRVNLGHLARNRANASTRTERAGPRSQSVYRQCRKSPLLTRYLINK